MLFSKKTLIWKFYTNNEALFTTEQVEISNQKNLF